MTMPSRRLWPRLLAVLLLHLLAVTALEDASSHQTIQYTGSLDSLKTELPHLDAKQAVGAVNTAQQLLSQIKSSNSYSRFTRFRKPTGFVSKSWYYASKVFTFLFINGPSIDSSSSSASPSPAWERSQPWYIPMRLLEAAKTANNSDALYTLADVSFYGRYGHPRNYHKAFDNYQALASLDGNATAQHMLGLMHATGLGGVVEKDQAKALIYHTFAADGGNTQSQMTLGYRYHAGVATARNCDKATAYYKKVADKAMAYVRAGPPGGEQISKEAYRLADELGGPFGDGESSKRGSPSTDQNAAFDDVLDYLDLMSRKGELKATFGLGRLHYEGSRALRQDYAVAKDFFLDVARKYWTKAGKVRPDTEPGLDKLASKAAGYLGRMFLRGEGMDQNFAKAKVWFSRGLDNGDALCQYSLGLMHLNGLGVDRDAARAADYFGAAADQDFASAQVRLGALFLDQGDLQPAVDYFKLATRNNHIEAFYYLAEIYNQDIGKSERSCTSAVLFYKTVAELAEPVHSRFADANDAYDAGDLDRALAFFAMAAEQGYEVGQANVAFLLDPPRRPLSPLAALLPWAQRRVSRLGDHALALIYWTRSARQANLDSLVKMGDYYLDGLGAQADAERAAACYQAAAETHQSAQAMWNLGWMHENGVGIEQDFHLAKRFYDESLETNARAYLPVTLALVKLRARSLWNTLTRGRVNSIRDDDNDDSRRRRHSYTFAEWVANFLEADFELYAERLAREGEDAAALQQDEWDTATGMPGGDADDLYLDVDDGFVEMLAILGLAGALAFLVYYRQQAVARRGGGGGGAGARQQQQQQQNNGQAQGNNQQPPNGQDQAPNQQQPQDQGDGQDEAERRQQQGDRGLFPPPGDPAHLDWVAGGVGH